MKLVAFLAALPVSVLLLKKRKKVQRLFIGGAVLGLSAKTATQARRLIYNTFASKGRIEKIDIVTSETLKGAFIWQLWLHTDSPTSTWDPLPNNWTMADGTRLTIKSVRVA